MILMIFPPSLLSPYPSMKLTVFRILARINKVALPSYKDRDLTRLSKFDKAIIGWRYWITKNALGN